MKHIRLRAQMSDAEVRETCRARLCTPLDYEQLLAGDESALVYKPSGELLLGVLREEIPSELRAAALPSLQALKSYKTENRGSYTAAVRRFTEFADGSRSSNSRTRDAEGKTISVASAIIGYFDRQGGRFPFCRPTAFISREVEKWTALAPLIQLVDATFKRVLPERHLAQKNFIQQVRPEWRIGGTVFTTLTVNNNVTAGVHLDKGDFKDGFGVITCHRSGEYTGGELCFPQYRVGVDLRDGDLLFFNSHDWHGMTPIVGEPDTYERITCVYYARTKMKNCGTAAEELENARRSRGQL